jgi:hypothetical protein
VGVTFSSSGPSDYALNVVNAKPNNTDLGLQISYGIFQGTPAVYPNNIASRYSKQPSSVINTIMGTVGAHELLHRMGSGDLKFAEDNPNDLMSVDTNPNFNQVLIDNSLKLTQSEGRRFRRGVSRNIQRAK